MEIKDKIFKRKSGKSKGRWVVRIQYVNPLTGKAQSMERHADKKSEAGDERDRLIIDIQKSHGQIKKGEKMTFRELTQVCLERFYRPAVLLDGRKVEGVRSTNTANNHITVLNQFFGDQMIGQITTDHLREYRLWRIQIGSRHPSIQPEDDKKPIKLATINRELSAMRRMMRFALSQGWVTRDIFFKAEIIDTSAEVERKRLLTADEETRLLNACQGTREVPYERKRFGKTENILATHSVDNPHLKAMILLALDSGMRRGEILKLRWEDIDFGNGLIRVIGTHTKTERERLVPLTDRVEAELVRVREFTMGVRPFPFTDFKRSWATAKKLAGIEDLHFHDLRRTAITRWIKDGHAMAIAGKIAGHSRLETTMKHYTAADAEMVRNLSKQMNDLHKESRGAFDAETIH